MGNKNYLWTKKGKKQFNKLSPKDQATVASVAIADAVDKAMRKKVTEAMIAGMRFQQDAFYQRYVQRIDKLEPYTTDWNDLVEHLLSEIRLGHIEYEKMMQCNDEEGTHNED